MRWYVQVALILIGHVHSILVSHRCGHKLKSDRKLATRLPLPMLAIMILISIGGVYLMLLDMNMRVGRMVRVNPVVVPHHIFAWRFCGGQSLFRAGRNPQALRVPVVLFEAILALWQPLN